MSPTVTVPLLEFPEPLLGGGLAWLLDPAAARSERFGPAGRPVRLHAVTSFQEPDHA